MYLVYKTDTWHSYESRDIIGVATSEASAVLICIEQAKVDGEDLETNSDELHNLVNLKQTQGYSGEGEFQFEKVEIDTLI